ncbi:MAG: hypothetical protein KAU26_03040 [Methylococcales bacterium]|nr:hypothetical protein [Methylococcales bacterium]
MNEPQYSLFFNVIVLFVCSSIGLYTLYDLSYSWPHKGCFVWFIVVFISPVFLYYSITIGYFLGTQKPLIQKKTTGLFSLIFGVLFAGGLLQYTQSNSLQRFSRIYAPMIQKIQQNMPEPCHHAYFEMVDIKIYNAQIHRAMTKDNRPVGGLLYNEDQFILYFLTQSINIEGSTLFYDSVVEKWQLFQNNTLHGKSTFQQQYLTLTECNTPYFSPPIS